MEILDVMWFCGRSNVGIVRVLDEYEGIKYYIGSPAGVDEETDKNWIASWGSTFPIDAGDVLFGLDPVKNGEAVSVPLNREQAELMVRLGSHYLGTV